jgi:hypothetical protein
MLSFLRRKPRKKTDTPLSDAKHFRNVVGQCAYGKNPMTITISSNGHGSGVVVKPDDALTHYLFQWAQGICFQLACKGVATTDIPNGNKNLDPDAAEDLVTYLKFWGEMMASTGEFPVLMISRREPNEQRMLVTPGYEPDQLKQILQWAAMQSDKLTAEIKIEHS